MEPYSNGCFGYQMAISSCRHPLVRLSTVHPSVTVDPENRQDNFWMTKFLSSWWRGGTISLRTGGRGHPTPILTPNPTPYTNIYKKYPKRSFFHFSTRSPLRTNGRTDGRTKPLVACPKKSEQYLGPRRRGVKDHQFHKIPTTKRSLTL